MNCSRIFLKEQFKNCSWQQFRNSLAILTFKICALTTNFAQFLNNYRKNSKISGTQKFIVIILKVEQDGISLE